ncbi:MAG: pyridoxamine 5'-phosphate oxidase [Chitinispirillaceae bacterium]
MNSADLSHIRREYSGGPLRKKSTPRNPFSLFHQWFEKISALKPEDVNAMMLATASKSGLPDARTVLLKEFSSEGFSFFTNYQSRKGEELEENPKAAILFYWPEVFRQIKVEGQIRTIPAKESDLYFSTRPRGSQLAAWASQQSAVIQSRDDLHTRAKELRNHYENRKIPRPTYWGGYRLIPSLFEFWQGQPDRLHDRIQYRLDFKNNWIKERLAP